MRPGQKDMGQRNSGVEIFENKVGATQINSVLAHCLICFHKLDIEILLHFT